LALLDIGERTGVDDRLGQALGDWGGGIIEEEAVEDDGEEIAKRTLARKGGMTPLHEACAMGEFVRVKALINAGADIEAVDEDGMTPYHYSEAGQMTESTAAIIRGDEIGTGDDFNPKVKAFMLCLNEIRVFYVLKDPDFRKNDKGTWGDCYARAMMELGRESWLRKENPAAARRLALPIEKLSNQK
jgi:hypothetical protein